jgi:hypothetical protein
MRRYNGPELSCGNVQLRTGSSLRVSVLYDVLMISFSRGEKHAVLSVSLSEWLGGY